eukprot:2803808-Rhodomonas_salina.2
MLFGDAIRPCARQQNADTYRNEPHAKLQLARTMTTASRGRASLEECAYLCWVDSTCGTFWHNARVRAPHFQSACKGRGGDKGEGSGVRGQGSRVLGIRLESQESGVRGQGSGVKVKNEG